MTTLNTLVQGKFAQTLQFINCCFPALSTPHVSSFALEITILKTKSKANLVCIQWECKTQLQKYHTQWIDQENIEELTDISDQLLQQSDIDTSISNIHIVQSTKSGRLSIAKQRFTTGNVVALASPLALILTKENIQSHCHYCCKKFVSKIYQCGNCQYSRYCNRNCLDEDENLHMYQCKVLAAIKNSLFTTTTSRTDQLDMDLCRLTLSVLLMEALIGVKDLLTDLIIPNQKTKSTAMGIDLQQEERLIRSWLKSYIEIPISISPSHIQVTLQRVKANAHPLFIQNGLCAGLGLFPYAARTINHSCTPNVVPHFNPSTRKLQFHALYTIEPNEAIEYSYLTDLLVSTKNRQEILNNGFDIKCTCWRCVNDSASIIHREMEDNEEKECMADLSTFQHEHVNTKVGVMDYTRLNKLYIKHKNLLERNNYLQFTYNMLAMTITRKQLQWKSMIQYIEKLIHAWTSNSLPEYYPTIELLYHQLQIAAKQGGDEHNYKIATQKLEDFQQFYQ